MAAAVSPERDRFGVFELQLDERLLLKDGEAIPLRPRAFASAAKAPMSLMKSRRV